jgi:formate hydrogenlyase regulatory protein HycA
VPGPSRIPIAHEPGYRTDRIGRYDGGLFFAAAWDHHAYVHLFDHDGRHQTSTVVLYGDIAVQLFQTEFEGVLFGLVDESGDRAGDGRHVDWVELYPDRLGFHEPWDGTYST